MRRNLVSVVTILMTGLLLVLTAPASADTGDAIVRISTTYTKPDFFRPWLNQGQARRSGSGCVISGNRILTNAHVVSDASFIEVRLAGSAERVVANVLAVSHELDLAILEVEDKSFFKDVTPLEFGTMPDIGDRVQAYGFPSGGLRLTVTEGIVSRIDRRTYSQAGYANLICQFDASINSGSSGGPVIKDNKIVGIVFQTGSGENVSFMVPAPVIKHFFDDLADGTHQGVPDLGMVYQYLRNKQQRDSLGMTDEQSGVLILEPQPGFQGQDKLMPGDIILSIEGQQVANDATIAWRDNQRMSFMLIVEEKQLGDPLTLRLLRNGTEIDVTFPLLIAKRDNLNPVPSITYETRPTYYIIGGVVFSPLTLNYLYQWDKWSNVPLELRGYNALSRRLENQQRKHFVVVVDVLPDAVNQGYTGFEDRVVSTVNGKTINSIQDLVRAIEENQDPFHVITVEAFQSKMVFAREGLDEKSQKVLDKYDVPSDRSDDLKNITNE
jgi:S1-C subfamily serine protease